MTPEISLRERIALAERLRTSKQAVAEAVTEEFFQRHPDWLARYGERGRRLGIEDACFHIDFLAGAIESGATEPFEDYARWTARMLASRGIVPQFVRENLEQIQAALLPQLSAAEQAWVAAVVHAGCAACMEPQASSSTEVRTGLALTQRLFLQAILKGQRMAAVNIALEALREGHEIQDIYVDILQESLYEVGRLWETNKISVAEEHMATAITQYAVAQLFPRLKLATEVRGRMVITGVEGELHQVGANMVADVLESDGWDVRFLGTNMPHSGILKSIDEHHADVLGISSTMLFNVPRVIALIAAVREQFGTRAPRIILGGGAFRSTPELYRELGVDGFASDLRAALAASPDLARQG